MQIVIFKDGTCTPGNGRYMLGVAPRDVDPIITGFINKVPMRDIHRVKVYLCHDMTSFDEVIHYHGVRGRTIGHSASRIKEIDVRCLKEYLDIAWQEAQHRQTEQRQAIDRRVRNSDPGKLRESLLALMAYN